ncbi:MAG TPA: SGNH/GDSL hydrolase family protein [Thermoanaerobaculia bacterium]
MPQTRKALAVLLGTLAALVAGELLLRIAGAAPEVAPVRQGRMQLSANPRLVFEPVPGLRHEGDPSGFFEYRGQSNSLGYRDREHSVEKPPGTYRIAVLGDSIAAGYRIERTEDAFPARLEALLRARGLPVEVLSFGVTGYNTAQEVETLRARALRFDPDLVLLAYCHNDRRPPDPRIIQGLREAQGGRRVVPLTAVDRRLAWSALYRLLRFQVLDSAAREDAGAAAAGEQAVARSLDDLGRMSREEGFEVLLAVFPYLPKLYDKEHARQHARLAEIARRNGFHHLDLRPVFRDCRLARPDKLRFDRYHPTAAGHRCAAEAMAETVRPIFRRAAARPDGAPVPPSAR